MRSLLGPDPPWPKKGLPNERQTERQIASKPPASARAKGFAGTSTLLRDLLERTRAASTLSDLREPLEAKLLLTSASDFAERPVSTAGSDLPAPTLSGRPTRFGTFLIGSDRSAQRGLSMVRRFPPVRRPRCPMAPNSWQKAYANAAGSRPYKLYVPSCYEGQPLPLIVMLHGCTQSPDDFAAGTRMNVLAEEHACLVAYPGQTQSANSSKCWNWFSPQDQRRDQGEPSLIAGITRQIMSDYAVDCTTRLHCRTLGRRCCGQHHGCGVPRPLCRRWSAFRSRLWVRPRRPFCLCRNEARRAGVRSGRRRRRFTRADADDHLPWRPRQDRASDQRRPGRCSFESRRQNEHECQARAEFWRHWLFVYGSCRCV